MRRPWFLGRIVELMGARAWAANIALVRANARFGAEIAAAYAQARGDAQLNGCVSITMSP